MNALLILAAREQCYEAAMWAWVAEVPMSWLGVQQ